MTREGVAGGVGAGFGTRWFSPGTLAGNFLRGSKMLTVTHIVKPIILDPRIPDHRPLIRRLMLLTPPTPSVH